jgi:purine-nucleoside phosphorylase
MGDLARRVAKSVAYVRSRTQLTPRVAIVLGSGLGALARRIEPEAEFSFGELPHFAPATATGHLGKLIVGRYAGVPVVVMQGRVHAYEGHPAEQVAFPVRVMRGLGADRLVVTNAAGGLNPHFKVGDIVLLEDQINLGFWNPLVAAKRGSDSGRWLDMSSPYDSDLRAAALGVARRRAMLCHQGLYVGMLGPTFETRAEYRMLRRLGGDLVGMSTVGEVVVARQVGFRVLGVSVVSNACTPDRLGQTSGAEVLAAVARAVSRVGTLVEGVLAELAANRPG